MHQIIKTPSLPQKIDFKVDNIYLSNVDISVKKEEKQEKQVGKRNKINFKKYIYTIDYNQEYVGTIIYWIKIGNLPKKVK
jgi:hypothetical protein